MNLKCLLFTFTITLCFFSAKSTWAQNEYLISYEKLTTYSPGTFELLLPTLLDDNFPITKDSVFNNIDMQYTIDLYKTSYTW